MNDEICFLRPFAKLRSRQDQPIVILAELPADEAFAIWKQHVLGDKPR